MQVCVCARVYAYVPVHVCLERSQVESIELEGLGCGISYPLSNLISIHMLVDGLFLKLSCFKSVLHYSL